MIALDRASEAVVKSLAKAEWQGASFLTIQREAPKRGESFSMQGWLADLAGRTKNLVDEIAAADQVVMVATAGENAEAASIIGEACEPETFNDHRAGDLSAARPPTTHCRRRSRTCVPGR